MDMSSILIRSTKIFLTYGIIIQNWGQCFNKGKVCTISKAKYWHKMQDGRLPDDGYLYSIEEDGGYWSWASSMFEPEF